MDHLVPPGKNGAGAWGNLNHDNLWDKVSWHRDDFSVTASDNTIRILTTVHYAAELAWGGPTGHARTLKTGCGDVEKNILSASLAVGVAVTITPNPDWSLTLHPMLIGPTTSTPCRLKILSFPVYDASQKIANTVKNFLTPKLTEIANRINAQLQFKDKAVAVWQQLQTPIALGPGIYFVAALNGASLSPLTTSDNKLKLVAGVSGTAWVGIGSPVAVTPSPLPPLQIVDRPGGFHIALPITVSYDQLGAELNRLLSGRRYPFGKHTVTIKGVSVYGTSDKLVFQVDASLSGVGSARVYITGTPAYDALRQVVSAGDLRYTVNTQNALIKVADWFLHSEFLNILESEAHYDIVDQIKTMRAKATAAVNRRLSPHADLAGSVDNLSLVGFSLSPGALTTYLDASGHARVSVH